MAGILSGVEKFFTKERIMIFVFFGVLIVLLMWYSGNKYGVMDSMDTGMQPPSSMPQMQQPNNGMSSVMNSNAPTSHPSSPPSNPAVQPVAGSGYTLQPIMNPNDLLPSDQNSQWASLNPAGQGNPIMPDLLQAGYHIGLDTIGQTLKNPNYQLRSDPPIPKKEVGPWNQSTIEPDLMRVPLEVGYGPQ